MRASGCGRSLIAGGKSNLTYVVSDGEQEWIVRRPPLGHVLATAHDMAREYRVMTALRDTAVPVPADLSLLCTDSAVLGAPFYVMERCAGTPYRHAAELEQLGAERTRTIATNASLTPSPPCTRWSRRRRAGGLRPPGGVPRLARFPMEEAARRVVQP